MRRRGLRTRAAVIVASLAAVMVGVAAAEEAAAAVYPLSRSGTKDCRNWGNVMVRAEFSRIEGARFATGPVGSPASWRRTAAGTGTDLETIVSWATKSPHTYARWSIVTDRAYARAPIGLASGGASCTFDYVGGTVLESRTGGTKTCPSGQHVIIVADAFKPVSHFWTPAGQYDVLRVAHGGGGSLNTSFTDTGSRSISSWRVNAYHQAGYTDGGKRFETVFLTCSGSQKVS